MSTPLASFFTKIGFEVDPSALKKVENTFDRLQKQAQGMAKALQTPTQRMKERLNVSAMRQQVLLQDKKNQGILNQINSSKNLVRQRERESRLDDAARRHSMFMEKARQRALSSTAKMGELAERARMKSTPYAQRTNASGGRSSVGLDSSGGFGRLSVPTTLGTVAGGLAAQRITQKAYHTANFQMAQPVQYEFITGSAEAGAKQVAFLNKEVDRLGLSLLDASQQYKQLLATSYKPLGEEQTQKLFTSAQNLATMLGLTTDAQNRMFRAFGQMSSKGQVMAEELKGQLAESLPGATQIFADALFGGDVKQLFDQMEKGLVRMPELNKVIDFMATLKDDELMARMQKSPEKAMQRMNTAVTRLFITLNEVGAIDAMTAALGGLADGVKALHATIKPLSVMFRNLWGHTKDLYNLVSSFASLLGGIFFKNSMTTLLTITLLTIRFQAFGIAVLRILPLLGRGTALLTKIAPLTTKAALALSFLWKKLLVPAAVTAGLLLLEDLIFALRGQGSVLADLAKDGEGFSAVLAKIVISIGSIVQFVMGLGFSLYDRLFGTGDWGYLTEVFDTFRMQMNNLFPFDEWAREFLELGKLIVGVANPLTAGGAIARYSGFRDAVANYNPTSAAMAPSLIAKPNPRAFGGGYDAPAPSTINFNPNIVINGSGLNQAQLESTVNNVLQKQYTQAKANYVMAR